MEPRTAATRVPDPDAADFVRFCYRRRRVGWPELYDEMCAVAARGLYRGYSTDDLAGIGIGFALFDMPALAALAHRVVTEEQALRRPVSVTIVATPEAAVVDATPVAELVAAATATADATDVSAHQLSSPVPAGPAADTTPAATAPAIRLAPVPA